MLFSILLVLQSSEAYFAFGPCPTPTLQPNFAITQYLGKWYDVVHCKDFLWEIGGECDTAIYGKSSTPGQISVLNSEYVNNEWKSNAGNATCQSSAPAHCAVKFYPTAPAGDYEVVQTDYTDTSLVFSCTGNGQGHDMWAWVLGRTPTVDYSKLIPVIQSLGIPTSELRYTVQTGCPPQPTIA